jgi:hypothetical protein
MHGFGECSIPVREPWALSQRLPSFSVLLSATLDLDQCAAASQVI